MRRRLSRSESGRPPLISFSRSLEIVITSTLYHFLFVIWYLSNINILFPGNRNKRERGRPRPGCNTDLRRKMDEKILSNHQVWPETLSICQTQPTKLFYPCWWKKQFAGLFNSPLKDFHWPDPLVVGSCPLILPLEGEAEDWVGCWVIRLQAHQHPQIRHSPKILHKPLYLSSVFENFVVERDIDR